jgi:alpha-D-xyloside xylohydrolase
VPVAVLVVLGLWQAWILPYRGWPSRAELARAVVHSRHPEGFAPVDAAPVTWVGDQRHTWRAEDEGIEEAIRDILRSASLGYGVVGSDIAGFGGPEIPARLYIRWAQFSAFCGLFLNGGHGERALWMRTERELEIIREFAWLHTELLPYIYSHVVDAHEGGPPLMRPVEGRYHYLFGDDLLVAPIYEDRLSRRVNLPAGRWRYLFDDREMIEGPRTFTREYPLDEYPVFVRDGAVVPMQVSRSYTGFGDAESAGFLTLLVYPHGSSAFSVRHPDGAGETVVRVASDDEDVSITLSGVRRPHLLRVLLESRPERVVLDGNALPESGTWSYEAERRLLLVRTKDYQEGEYHIR